MTASGESVAGAGLDMPFGDYELLDEVARGGMGVVYRARQISLDRIVAVKMMLGGALATPEFVQRFRTEAAAAAVLHHPNIVAIHEVGLHAGHHYFSMDFVDGPNLAAVVGHQALPARRAAQYLKVIAEAIHHAHEQGILHRDLKPSNVLIDAHDQPRLTDFGLAKRLEAGSSLTLSGQVLGSPNFMPPEQASGKGGKVGRYSDVYGLGGILYHLLTARPPFQADSLEAVVSQVLSTEPLSPRLLNPTVPRDLETICLKCLEKDPLRRYATAQEVADEAGRFLRQEPIVARPVGRAGKVWRWCRRKPQAASLAGVAILTFLLGFAGVLWEWRRAESQRARAEANEYVLSMNVAQQALRANNPGRALELLNRHRPGNASLAADLRGFEWRYLWQQCQSEAEAEIGKLASPVHSLEVSRDGQWLFAGSVGGEPKLWNLSTREQVPVAGEADWSWGAFSPDSRLLLACAETGQSYGKILVWDLQARKHLEPIRDPRRIATMAFSADGRWFGYGVHQPPWDRRVVILDFPERKKVRELITRTPLRSWDFGFDWVFTRDGRRLIFSENEPRPELGLCDLGASAPQYFPGHREPISAMALDPDDKILATGAGYTETAIKLWEVPSFRPLGELTNHQAWITALSFSPDGRTLASAGADQTLRLWDVPTRTQQRAFVALSTDVLRLRFTPNGKTLFTGSRDGTINQWLLAVPPLQRQPRVWPSPPDLGDRVLAPDARRIAALQHRAVYVGEVEAERLPSRLSELGTNNTCLLFSSDGESVFAGTQAGEVQVWSLRGHQLLQRLRGAKEPVKLLCQDPKGRVLVTVQSSADFEVERPYPPNRVVVWNTAEWREQNSWVVQTPSRKLLATDGRWLAMNYSTRTIQVWNLSDPVETNRLPFEGEILNITFSPNGQLLAAANSAGTVKVWEVLGFREQRRFQAHAHPVCALAFSPGRLRLATASEGDEAIKLWDVSTWQELITLPHGGKKLQELLFTADGNQLVARTSEDDFLVWRVPSLAEIENIKPSVR